MALLTVLEGRKVYLVMLPFILGSTVFVSIYLNTSKHAISVQVDEENAKFATRGCWELELPLSNATKVEFIIAYPLKPAQIKQLLFHSGTETIRKRLTGDLCATKSAIANCLIEAKEMRGICADLPPIIKSLSVPEELAHLYTLLRHVIAC